MHRASLLILFLFSAVFSSQTRAIYEYRFAIDSTRKDSVVSELMYLDISQKGSKFYSKQAHDSDSLAAAEVRKQIASKSSNIQIKRSGQSAVGFEVEKTSGKEVYLLTTVGRDYFRVKDERGISWTIHPETAVHEELKIQKATTHFAGRDWTAWFSAEVPISEGPYKFHGLPGLIVKLESKDHSHSFTLKGLRKSPGSSADMSLPQGVEVPFFSRKAIEVDRMQYKKHLEQYRKDPVQGMREMLSQPNSKVVINVGGVEYSNPQDILRQMEKSARAREKKRNNPIELEN